MQKTQLTGNSPNTFSMYLLYEHYIHIPNCTRLDTKRGAAE